MKIGIDLRLLGKKHGGIGRYSFEIAKNLLELDESHQFLFFYNTDAAQEDLDALTAHANAQLIQVNTRHYSIAEQSSFLRTLNKHKVDVMHFPNFNVPIFYKKPFVVTIHDMVHHKISGAKKSHLLHFYAYQKVIEAAAKNSKRIVTVSQVSKKDIAETLHIHPNKIAVTYEGTNLNPNIEALEVEKIKKRYFLHKPYFIFVGVLERKKNLINLTRGFDLFLKTHKSDMDLVVVGKIDKHYPDIKHHAMDIAYKDHLVFTGYVEDDELAALYKGAYAYANASLHEGFGLPGVEAMQFALPLLVSNIPVFNEIYDNAAVYFHGEDVKDIAEKMHLLTRDIGFYQQLQKNSFERASQFSWKKCAEETLEIYKSAIA